MRNIISNIIVGVVSAALYGIYGVSAFVSDHQTGSKSVISYGQRAFIQSKFMGDQREFYVYLPEDYNQTTKKYPVIYVLDGGFLFEPTVTVSKIRAARDLMPHSIVVALPNDTNALRFGMGMPKKRTPDTPRISFEHGKAKEMFSFLEKELVPYIDGHYRTARHRSLVGMSPTVGPVTTGYLQGSTTFQAYISFAADADFYTMDGSLIADKLVMEAQARQKNQQHKSWLYIGRAQADMGGKEGRTAVFNQLSMSFKQLTGNSHAVVDIVPDSEHYASALEGLINAFAFIYPAERMSPDYVAFWESDDPYQAIRSFYNDLSANYGFEIYPALDGYWHGFSLRGLTWQLVNRKKYEALLQVSDWGLSIYPQSFQLYARKARYYEAQGMTEKAIHAADQAYQLAKARNNPLAGALKSMRDQLQVE